MEAVVAVVRLDPRNGEPISRKAEAGIRMLRCEKTQIETFTDVDFAMCVQRRLCASDTYCGWIDSTLFYVQGWVHALDKNPRAGSPHRLAVDKVIPVNVSALVGEAATLTGAFQIIVYDLLKNQVACIVDRTASRPIYYYLDENLLILSSDIRAIVGIPGLDFSIDIAALVQFIRVQTIM